MKEMKKLLCSLLFLITGWQVAQAQDLSRFKVLSDSTYQTTEKQSDNKYKKETNIKMNKEMKFCQSCGMPLTEDVLGTNADGSKNEDYCMYCYRDGKFLQDCTMEEMIEHCCCQRGVGEPHHQRRIYRYDENVFPPIKALAQNVGY